MNVITQPHFFLFLEHHSKSLFFYLTILPSDNPGLTGFTNIFNEKGSLLADLP